ncbi:outer membrane protein assembly factor BamE [uncultured Shimia sp.]|uniref:outer membrane protein assembly factor BamE n=1 Tax=uncultured Shimia sp. TaxID=573152 RepID=UPI002624F414|nr:outer membrane protein assembly factor BamE [uncultured Shimia sp.]
MTGGLNRMRWAVLALCFVGLVACTTQYRNHGYVPVPEDLEKIKVGVDTRESVAEAVGTPSASGVLNESGYYYVRTQIRHYGARKPKVVDRRLLAITFDSNGRVRNIEEFTLEDGNVVPLTRRITDNDVENPGFIKQILGNIGNFGPVGF